MVFWTPVRHEKIFGKFDLYTCRFGIVIIGYKSEY
jgi:hypothetical protein